MKNISNNIILEINGDKGLDYIANSLQLEWGKYQVYNIINVPKTDYALFYENLATQLGTIEACRPVNDKSKEFSKSRDIKPDPSVYHFYAAKTRQPLHTDHAHYPLSQSPDWVYMYCLEASDFGGTTRILSLSKLKKIMEQYNPKLLEKLSINASYGYVGPNGDEIHTKPILFNDIINWNYWQIKPKINSKEVLKVREEFFRFLEDVIGDGCMYDFSKIWSKGDLIIFNDKKVMHGRDAFLGDRWLKTFSLFNKK